jgi:hypothetical protein
MNLEVDISAKSMLDYFLVVIESTIGCEIIDFDPF